MTTIQTDRTTMFSEAQARFLVAKINQEFRRRTKRDADTGREYYDPPFTAEECDQAERLLLAIYQSRAAQNPNLPNPQTVKEMHSLLCPQDLAGSLSEPITCRDLDKPSACLSATK